MGDDWGGGWHGRLSKGWENRRWGMIRVVIRVVDGMGG